MYQSGVRDLYTRLARPPGVAHRPATSPSYYSQGQARLARLPARVGSQRDAGGQHRTPPQPPPNHGHHRSHDHRHHHRHRQARSGRLLGEASAVTFHFVWVHQEKFNQPYVEAMGGYWRACNARSAAEKAAVPHRECMAARMQDGRDADAAKARHA